MSLVSPQIILVKTLANQLYLDFRITANYELSRNFLDKYPVVGVIQKVSG